VCGDVDGITVDGWFNYPGSPPRVWEHTLGQLDANALTGSPPRVRGARLTSLESGTGKWTTPARTGSTSTTRTTRTDWPDHPRAYGEHISVRTQWPPTADHPRVCGEHWQRVPLPALPAGPPPRVRGAPLRARPFLRRVRTTPARTGSTTGVKVINWNQDGPPRAYGEHQSKARFSAGGIGPPPRVREHRRPDSGSIR